jgi:hypothetical protein
MGVKLHYSSFLFQCNGLWLGTSTYSNAPMVATTQVLPIDLRSGLLRTTKGLARVIHADADQ